MDRTTESFFKLFPSQIHTQGPIGLALELRSRVAPAEIASLRIHTYRTALRSAATEPQKWNPQTRETADHSIPCLVAAAFHGGAITPDSFTSDRIQDPALCPLIAKMTIVEDPDFTRRFPQEANCRMEVTTVSGQRFVAETVYPKGHQRNPLQDAEVDAKFRHLSHAVLPEAQCRTALDLLWSFEHVPNLRALFASLVL
ncbi:MAG: MmgE/PrpD family protein [Nitrospinae bacterium]|nr:MmgE/PrpD family protein [Nitrospinota bacterium]